MTTQNKNALISMAYVSQSANNPYSVFCEYIKYCVFSNPSDSLTISEIRDSVGQEFGIYLPHHIMSQCFSILVKDGIITHCNHLITRKGQYDLETFEIHRKEFKRIEADLINELRHFVIQYNKEWDEDYARAMLIKVLDKQGLALEIFFRGKNTSEFSLAEIETDDDQLEIEKASDETNCPLYSEEYLVGKFIKKLIESNSIQKDYLLQICAGLLICSGAYQLPSNKAQIEHPQIKGTSFLFDTKLLLRFIECAGEAAIAATKELVKLIQDAGGQVFYYPQTKEEVELAFDDAIKKITNGYPPKDDEMRLYAARIKNSLTVLKAKKANFVGELATAHIYEKPLGDYTDMDNIKYGFDIAILKQYMYQNLSWEKQTIDNDALSIWETHMRRRGRYDDYCGTSKQLDVFVTSNTKLIGVTLGFKAEKQHIDSIQSWKANRLPVITDIRLTCRLWTPASQAQQMSILYLSENVIAALRPTKRYLERIRELAIELEKQVPEYSGISLPTFFDDNITDAILETTKGEESALDIGSFASTINELTEWKAKEQEEKTNNVIIERDNANQELTLQRETIISGAVEQFKEKLGWRRPVLFLAKHWAKASSVFFVIISSVISIFTGTWHTLLIILIPIAIKLLDVFTASKRIETFIIRSSLEKIESSFSKYISSKLRKVELPYEKEIVNQSIEKTGILLECHNILDDLVKNQKGDNNNA